MANICLQLDILFDNSRHIYENSMKLVESITGTNKKQIFMDVVAKQMNRKLMKCVQHHRIILQ